MRIPEGRGHYLGALQVSGRAPLTSTDGNAPAAGRARSLAPAVSLVLQRVRRLLAGEERLPREQVAALLQQLVGEVGETRSSLLRELRDGHPALQPPQPRRADAGCAADLLQHAFEFAAAPA